MKPIFGDEGSIPSFPTRLLALYLPTGTPMIMAAKLVGAGAIAAVQRGLTAGVFLPRAPSTGRTP